MRCIFKIHTKDENQKTCSKIRTDLATIAWLAVIMILIASLAVVLTSSGISMDSFGIEKIVKPLSYLISNSNLPGSDNVLIKSFLSIEDPELDTQKIARDIHWSVNEQRDLHGLNPVAWNPSLSEIAKKNIVKI